MADLVHSCYTGAKIYRHNGMTATIVDSFASPGSGVVNGINWWMNGNLICSDQGDNKMYKMSGFSSTVLESFSYAGITSVFEGITNDGTNLLASDSTNDRITKLDGFSSTVLDSFASPAGVPEGLAWDGTDLYSTDFISARIYKHNGFSATISDSFASPGSRATGLTIDSDGDIWSGDWSANKIFHHSGFSSTITESFTGMSNIQGLTIIADIDLFTVTLQYEQAGGAFVNVTSALGDIGANVQPGNRTAYWDNPSQDRSNVEVSDQIVRINANPDANNEGTHSVNVTSAAQLSAGDGTGSVGDVKVEYEIT